MRFFPSIRPFCLFGRFCCCFICFGPFTTYCVTSVTQFNCHFLLVSLYFKSHINRPTIWVRRNLCRNSLKFWFIYLYKRYYYAIPACFCLFIFCECAFTYTPHAQILNLAFLWNALSPYVHVHIIPCSFTYALSDTVFRFFILLIFVE